MEATNGSISIEKKFNVTIRQVWQAWTERSQIMKWFGSDPDGKVLNAVLDVRPGGYFEITFKDGDLTEHTCSGIYKDVKEFSKLSFTWMWKSEPGIESMVTLWLTADGNNTLMQFEHADVGNASKHEYFKGWQDTFTKLERILTA